MKIFILLLILFLTSCAKVEVKKDINILMPNGAPSLAQIKIENNYKEIEGYNINIDRVGDPKLLGTGFVGDKYDIIYAPINMGVKQYNASNKYKVLTSITNGNVYFVSKNKLNSINDLNEKAIYLFGQNTINDVIVKEIFKTHNINTKSINYLASTQDTLKQFVSDKSDAVYLIAEPILSTKLSANNISYYTLDINKLLLDNGINFIQAAVFYKKDIDLKFLDKYYSLLDESINYVNNNIEVLDMIKNNDIGIPKNITMDTIKKCNIKLNRLNKEILDKLIDLNPKMFGGKPDESFYY